MTCPAPRRVFACARPGFVRPGHAVADPELGAGAGGLPGSVAGFPVQPLDTGMYYLYLACSASTFRMSQTNNASPVEVAMACDVPISCLDLDSPNPDRLHLSGWAYQQQQRPADTASSCSSVRFGSGGKAR